MKIMGSEKWSKNEKLTEDEVNNIVDFFYKDKRKELKKICNQILHIIWNDIPDYYRDDFESLAGYIITFCLESYDPTTGPFRAYVYPYMQKIFMELILLNVVVMEIGILKNVMKMVRKLRKA